MHEPPLSPPPFDRPLFAEPPPFAPLPASGPSSAEPMALALEEPATVRSVARDVVRTLRQPREAVPRSAQPWRVWWCVVRLYALGMIVAGAIVMVGVKASGAVNRLDDVSSAHERLVLLVLAGLVAPLWEETAFRLPLAPFHWARALPSLALLSFLLSTETPHALRPLWWGVFGLGAGLVLPTISNPQRREQAGLWWRRHFRWAVLLSIVGFGFAHAGNYRFPHHSPSAFLFVPLLVLPQLVAGALLAYVRLKLGYWFGVLLHASVNTFLVGLSLLAPDPHAKPALKPTPSTPRPQLRSKPGSRRQPTLATRPPARPADHASTAS